MKTMINNFEVYAQKLQSSFHPLRGGNLSVYRGVYLGLSNIGLGLLIGRATFSTLAGDNSNNLNPAVIYENSDIQKDQILQENKGKCGVYRLTNIVNKKTYVGSARNLRTRFYVYYSASRLASSNMVIYKGCNWVPALLRRAPYNLLRCHH
jgi:hypothetical protein